MWRARIGNYLKAKNRRIWKDLSHYPVSVPDNQISVLKKIGKFTLFFQFKNGRAESFENIPPYSQFKITLSPTPQLYGFSDIKSNVETKIDKENGPQAIRL